MPTLQKEDIKQRLSKIHSDYGWQSESLKPILPPTKRILNIGCDSGYESVALMWFMECGVVVGVDIDLSKAKDYALELKNVLLEATEAIRYPWVSDIDRKWWFSEVPSFLRNGMYPEFVEGDVSKLIDYLPKEFVGTFDLAYCSHVLCHIHRNQGVQDVKSSVHSIHRALSDDGCFIASEPIDHELSYFSELIGSVGFKVNTVDLSEKTSYMACK